jgi:tyrosyl-DNA phosphodiesterase-1
MAEPYPGINLISSYLPDPFGTHHSKMIILFRHDDCAQVIIHTANMISKDWANMTQAIWQSPLLPLCTPASASPSSSSEKEATRYPIGSGERFKIDLLHYLAKYENRLRALSSQLTNYDFSAVRAAFLGSAPSRQKVSATDPTQHTSLGWLGLQEILSNVPVPMPSVSAAPHIVLQVSSVATLGPKPTWLSRFESVLARCLLPKPAAPTHVPRPKFNIIFPTAQEIRSSLDGYDSGGSIHMRLQSAQQQKQLEYSRALFCHWDPRSSASPSNPRRQAHRGPAAPHIKTYIRFTDSRDQNIDWALLTSANLSKQAWGELANKDGEVRIQSYETGVVVWPALFADSGTKESASMVPVFGTDMPVSSGIPREAETEVEIDDDETEDEEVNDEDDDETEDEAPPSTRPQSTQPDPSRSGTRASLSNAQTASSIATQQKPNKVVGFRMPYDLPLSPYAPSDEPWCASMSYAVPDWMGVTWGV